MKRDNHLSDKSEGLSERAGKDTIGVFKRNRSSKVNAAISNDRRKYNS